MCAPGEQSGVEDQDAWRTQFRIIPVAKFSSVAGEEAVVRGGDYVEVFHRQSQGYLAVDTRHHMR